MTASRDEAFRMVVVGRVEKQARNAGWVGAGRVGGLQAEELA